MSRIYLLFPILICIAFIISAVQSYKVANQKLTSLEKAILSYSQAIKNIDADAILNAIPPQIIETLAAKKHLSTSQFQKIMKNQIEQLEENYKIENVQIDQKHKRKGKFDNDIPYFVMPVNFIATTNSGKKRSVQIEIIAIFDKNKWYFIPSNDKAILSITSKVFPGFEKIKINPQKITQIL
ncbi:hypothetical protein [Bartonella sp. B41]